MPSVIFLSTRKDFKHTIRQFFFLVAEIKADHIFDCLETRDVGELEPGRHRLFAFICFVVLIL